MQISHHATYNPTTCTEKFKFTISKSDFEAQRQPKDCLLMMIDALIEAIAFRVVTDRGHTHTNGLSVVEIFVRRKDDFPSDEQEGEARRLALALPGPSASPSPSPCPALGCAHLRLPRLLRHPRSS